MRKLHVDVQYVQCSSCLMWCRCGTGHTLGTCDLPPCAFDYVTSPDYPGDPTGLSPPPLLAARILRSLHGGRVGRQAGVVP